MAAHGKKPTFLTTEYTAKMVILQDPARQAWAVGWFSLCKQHVGLSVTVGRPHGLK